MFGGRLSVIWGCHHMAEVRAGEGEERDKVVIVTAGNTNEPGGGWCRGERGCTGIPA